MGKSSVVVKIVDQFNIQSVKAEDHTPVATDSDGPEFRLVTLEQVQTIAWQVRVFRGLSLIQYTQHTLEALGVISPNTTG